MDELKINEQVGMLLKSLTTANLRPEEKIVALHTTITIIDQIRIQTAVIESLTRAFNPTEKKTIN